MSPLHPRTDIAPLVEQLKQHAVEHDLVLIPAGLDLDLLPTVRLGPGITGTELDEFLTMSRACAVPVFYLVNGHEHLRATTTGKTGPTSLEVQWLHAGVLHTWQATA